MAAISFDTSARDLEAADDCRYRTAVGQRAADLALKGRETVDGPGHIFGHFIPVLPRPGSMPSASVMAGFTQQVSAFSEPAFAISDRAIERPRFPSLRAHRRHAMLQNVREVVFANHKDECFPIPDVGVELGALRPQIQREVLVEVVGADPC